LTTIVALICTVGLLLVALHVFGISTAFIFAVAQDYWSIINARGRR